MTDRRNCWRSTTNGYALNPTLLLTSKNLSKKCLRFRLQCASVEEYLKFILVASIPEKTFHKNPRQKCRGGVRFHGSVFASGAEPFSFLVSLSDQFCSQKVWSIFKWEKHQNISLSFTKKSNWNIAFRVVFFFFYLLRRKERSNRSRDQILSTKYRGRPALPGDGLKYLYSDLCCYWLTGLGVTSFDWVERVFRARLSF